MKRTFADRVKSERKVLGIVNDVCRQPTLNGLSRPAIDSWSLANPNASPRVSELLMLIARKVQMDVDTSKDVFDSDAKPLSTVEEYLQELRQALLGIECAIGDTQ
ncbi:MAG: hypothetical protein ABW165_07945 [Candidatus Thiodiazotropha sp.]